MTEQRGAAHHLWSSGGRQVGAAARGASAGIGNKGRACVNVCGGGGRASTPVEAYTGSWKSVARRSPCSLTTAHSLMARSYRGFSFAAFAPRHRNRLLCCARLSYCVSTFFRPWCVCDVARPLAHTAVPQVGDLARSRDHAMAQLANTQTRWGAGGGGQGRSAVRTTVGMGAWQVRYEMLDTIRRYGVGSNSLFPGHSLRTQGSFRVAHDDP